MLEEFLKDTLRRLDEIEERFGHDAPRAAPELDWRARLERNWPTLQNRMYSMARIIRRQAEALELITGKDENGEPLQKFYNLRTVAKSALGEIDGWIREAGK